MIRRSLVLAPSSHPFSRSHTLLIAIPGPSGYGIAIFVDDPTTVITSILVPAGV